MNNDVCHNSYSRSLWKSYLLEHWPIYLLGTLAVLVTNICQVLVTRNLGWILDFFSGVQIPAFFNRWNREETFMVLFLILLLSRIFLFIGRWGWRMTLARMTHYAAAMMRSKIWDAVRFFKRDDLDRDFSKGMLMNASTSDVNQARFVFGFTLVAVVDTLFLGILTVSTMLLIHVPLTLWSLGILVLLPIIVRRLSGLEIERYREAQEYLGDFNDLSSQVVSTIRLQRLTQTGGFWKKRLMDSAEEYRNKRLGAVFTSLLYIPLMGSASIVTYIVLFVIGIQYVLAGQMSVGDFVAMQGLIFLMQDPLFELGFIISDWKKGFTSMERLSEVYNRDRDETLLIHGRDTDEHDVIIEAKDLVFRFPESDTPLIKELDLLIKKGDRVGITGPIGSGKSTLVRILSGLFRNVDGKIHFLGQEFDQYSHENLRRYIGHVPQRPFLFATSIRENITMDRKMDDSEIWRYLELAGLDQDVRNFPDQLDTPLGEWGINLSGGQKQRLTLARALARTPKLLFLDDCLSAVDTVTEERILQNLDRELKDTTIIWVAHRRSTLKYCTQILEMA